MNTIHLGPCKTKEPQSQDSSRHHYVINLTEHFSALSDCKSIEIVCVNIVSWASWNQIAH